MRRDSGTNTKQRRSSQDIDAFLEAPCCVSHVLTAREPTRPTPKLLNSQTLKLPPGSWETSGFSLIEMMVASALLVVIMLGLVAMFFQTERAFRLGVVQSDTLEGGRSTIGFIARDFQELSASGDISTVHFFVGSKTNGVEQELGPFEWRTNELQSFFLLRRINDQWRGVRYDFTLADPNVPVAMLQRMDTGTLPPLPEVALLTNAFQVSRFLFQNRVATSPQHYGPVVDGVVHLTLRAYDSYGNPSTNYALNAYYEFTGTNLPAAVEVELGILDPKALQRARGLTGDNQKRFLEQHAANVHLFRQRIPIRSTQ